MLTKEKLTKALKVQNKIQETEDTYSFDFEIPPDLKSSFQYKAGQFVTLYMDINGQDIRRSYSLASSPDCDTAFRIAVKRVKGGIGSNYLIDQVQTGDVMYVTPPAGLFCLPENLDQTFGMFAAGSGITPIISLIKSALHRSTQSKVHLLYCNRDENSIIFHREIKSMGEKFAGRFFVEYALSSPVKPWDGYKGRVHGSYVKEFVQNQSLPKSTTHFICGPEGFMSTVESALEVMGYPRPQIKKESFAVSSSTTELAELNDEYVYIGDSAAASKPKELEIQLGGEWITVTAKEDQSVLETLLEEGHNPPYSCMDGSCMACLGKVQEGLVYQNDMGILTSDNTEAGECLTCQARPASQRVKISYDL